MAALNKAAAEVFEYFTGKVAKQADDIKAADAAQRAAPPAYVDPQRGQRVLEALNKYEDGSVYRSDIPVEERVAKFHGDTPEPQQNTYVQDSDMVELSGEYGFMPDVKGVKDLPPTGSDLAEFGLVEPPPSMKPYVDQGSREDTLEIPDTLPFVEDKTSYYRSLQMARRGSNRSFESGATRQFLDDLGLLGKPGNGDGFYDDVAFEFLRTKHSQSTAAEFTATLDTSDASHLFRGAKKGEFTNEIRGDKPIIVTVREESPGFVKMVDIDGPEGFKHKQVDIDFFNLQVPVILRTENGAKLMSEPRAIMTNAKKGSPLWVPVQARKGIFSDAADFTDVSSPKFWERQPRTPKEVDQAVSAMFSPEGQTFGASVSAQFWNKQFPGPEEFFSARMEFFKQPGRVRRRGTTTVKKGEGSNVWVGYQKAAQQQVFDRNAIVDHYKRLLKDPVIAERMRHFGYDSPFKLKHLGVTDPDLAEMPLIAYRTDQEFFDAAYTGDPVDMAQFSDTVAEMGPHYGFSKRAADEFLPLDSGDAETLIAYYNSVEKKVHEKMRSSINSVANVVPSMQLFDFFKYVEEILTAPTRLNPNPNITPVRTRDTMRESLKDVTERIVRGYSVKGDKADALVTIEQSLSDIVDYYASAYRNSSQQAHIIRAKRPLIMVDRAGFDPMRVADSMASMPEFKAYRDELVTIARTPETGVNYWKEYVAPNIANGKLDHPAVVGWKSTTARLRDIMRKEGFDSIVYANGLEAPGLPSIILIDQKDTKFTWATLFDRRSNYTLRGVGAASPLALAEANKEDTNVSN